MKKRLLGIILVAAMSISLIACGETTKESKVEIVPETEEPQETVVPTDEETKAEKVKVEETTESTESADTPVDVSPETPAYTVMDMSKTMYATSSVNVRSGPSTDYDKLGGLSQNQEVTVTGQADTGWYRINYNGSEAYVSDSYLVSEKVEVTPPADTANNNSNNENSNSSTSVKYGEINEEWFLTRGWLYDASNDLIYPTEETKAYFNQWAGKTIAEAEAEIGMGISMQGPWGESVSLGNNLKNIPIGTYYGIVNYAGHKLQMPF